MNNNKFKLIMKPYYLHREKSIKKILVDDELDCEYLDKINSFRPQIYVYHVCAGHDYYLEFPKNLHAYPSLYFCYKGDKSSSNIMKKLLDLRNAIIKYKVDYINHQHDEIYQIYYTIKNNDFLKEIYNVFRTI